MRAVITFLIITTICTVQAQELYQNDINTMLYVKVAFGGQQTADRDDSMKLGFTVNNSYTVPNQIGKTKFFNRKSFNRSLLDIEFSSRTKYFSKFNIGGVDALTYRTVMNADGEGIEWPMGLSTPQVVAGAILGVAIGYYIVESND